MKTEEEEEKKNRRDTESDIIICYSICFFFSLLNIL